jgi:hypothetical protein
MDKREEMENDYHFETQEGKNISKINKLRQKKWIKENRRKMIII